MHTPFVPSPELLVPKPVPNKEDFTLRIRPMTFFEKVLSRRDRYEREVQEAEVGLLRHAGDMTKRIRTDLHG